MGKMSGIVGGASSVARADRRARQSLALGLALIAVLLGASSADAFSQRGHVFAGSFGETFVNSEGIEKQGATEKLSKPSAVAVNEQATGPAAGDVYVLESANNRVMRYGPGPEHKFLEAWGFGVKEGGDAYERCEKECRAGAPGYGKAQLDAPDAIAVDSTAAGASSGDVYVVANRTWQHAVIYKFSADGELVATLFKKKEEREEEEPIEGVAVDSSGTLWVEREDEEEEALIQRFNDATQNELLAESELEFEMPGSEVSGRDRPVRPGFALDSEGNLYVTYEPDGEDAGAIEEEEEGIAERERARKERHEELKFEQPAERLDQPCEAHRCLEAKFKVGEEEALLEEVDGEATTGVATDGPAGEPRNDVFLDNRTSVAAFNPGGALIQRFGSEQLHDGGGGGLAVDPATGEVLVTDATAGRVDTYSLEPAGAPKIETGSVVFEHAKSTSVELRASIDPAGGEEPSYRFQYGTVSCAAQPASCTLLAPVSLDEGFNDQAASTQLEGLAPSTIYHFRVIAANGNGETASEEATFTTQASVVQASMLDGRAWELVSPADKHGASVESIRKEGGLIEAAAQGRSITYIANAPVGEKGEEPLGFRGPEPAQLISRRNGTTWSTEDIDTANGVPARGLVLGGPWEYQFFTPGLELALVNPFADGAPSSETEATEKTVYLRNMQTCATEPKSCYLPLVSTADDTAETPFGGAKLRFEGATPDLRRVFLNSDVGLTEGASPEGEGLYEWSGEKQPKKQLSLVSVLPDGQQAQGSIDVGSAVPEQARSGAVSEVVGPTGSHVVRVVWSYEHSSKECEEFCGHELFMRELTELDNGEAEARTLPLDEPNSGLSTAKNPTTYPLFQSANVQGSKVFFTYTEKLTEDAVAGKEAYEQNLYVFEPEKPAGHRVTDLSPDIVKGEGPGTVGGVLGTSENGEYVYFVANGVLAAGAEAGDCREMEPNEVHQDLESDAGCNLYVAHDGSDGWEQPRFIARLSSEDSPDWGTEAGIIDTLYDTQDLSSRVSPDGEWLAFMSERSLTGYDNIDANSGHADEEVYLFHYGSGLVCASCNPSGEPPVGVFETNVAGEGSGLLVDRPEAWASSEEGALEGVDSWLAGSLPGWTGSGSVSHSALYQSAYLSDSGRLFFNSADALVPVAKPTRREPIEDNLDHTREVGTENVYEYEPTGVGSCRTENTQGGCVAPISSGETEQESAFVDASANGEEVFFVTSAKLSPLETETTFSLYDARVCKEAGDEPCPTPPPESTQECTGKSGDECKSLSSVTETFEAPASATSSGSHNLVPKGAVLPSKVEKPKPKPLTRAQLLAKALKACKKDRHKSKRVACEKQAHKKYGGKARKSTAGSKSARASMRAKG
jgi:hypothetical protein